MSVKLLEGRTTLEKANSQPAATNINYISYKKYGFKL